MKTLKQQREILQKNLGISMNLPEVIDLPPTGTEYALIPHWNKIGTNYNDAVQKVFAALAKARNFYNYRDGQMGSDHLRQTTRKASITLPEILPVQLGEKNKGKSVKEVREHYATNEVGLGAYEMGMILLLNDDVLTKYEDLWIDCAGDEYDYPDSDVRFDQAPYFKFFDGRVKFGTVWFDGADAYCGTASGFVPQALEPLNIGSFDSSTFDPVDIIYIKYRDEFTGITVKHYGKKVTVETSKGEPSFYFKDSNKETIKKVCESILRLINQK